MRGLYSPIDKLAAELPRPRGTGAEFMAELSKRPGYKQQEAEDRGLQALVNLPKMERSQFLTALKYHKPAPAVEEKMLGAGSEDVSDDDQENQTHHERWTLPGGENYREMLIKAPQNKLQFPGNPQHFGGEPGILASMRLKDRFVPDLEGPHNVKVIGGGGHTNVKHPTREAAERFAEVKRQGGYKTEITPLNQKKLLHLEELQSDWHQKGRDKGYLPKDMAEQLSRAQGNYFNLRKELANAKASSDSHERDLKSEMPFYQDPAVRQRLQEAIVQANNKIMDLTPQVMKAEDAHRKLENLAEQGAPDAPFKKNWKRWRSRS